MGTNPSCSACQLDVASQRLALQQEKLELDKRLLKAEKKNIYQKYQALQSQLQQERREHEAAYKELALKSNQQQEELQQYRLKMQEAGNETLPPTADSDTGVQKQELVKELQAKLRKEREIAESDNEDLQAALQREKDDHESFVGEMEMKLSAQEKELQKYQGGAAPSSSTNFTIQQYKNKLQSLRLAMEVAVRRTESEWKAKVDELEVTLATQEGEFEDRLTAETERLQAELAELHEELESQEQLHAEETKQLVETIQGLTNGQVAGASAIVEQEKSSADQSKELKKMKTELSRLRHKHEDDLKSREEILTGLREVIAEVDLSDQDAFEEQVPSLETKLSSLQDQLDALELREQSFSESSSRRRSSTQSATKHHRDKLPHNLIKVDDIDWVGTHQKGKYTGYVNEAGEPHGRGILHVDNGDVYDGEWKNGKRHGVGIYTWHSGDLYTGPWHKNKRHGHGVFVWSDGRLYDGEYNMGKREGKGKFTWPYGAEYEGDYRGNKRNGYGVYHHADGRTYTGEYKDDRENGRGVETDADGNVLHEGKWSCGKFLGENDAKPVIA